MSVLDNSYEKKKEDERDGLCSGADCIGAEKERERWIYMFNP